MAIRDDLFSAVMAQLRNGSAAVEASELLNECVNRSRETGKPSELIIKLKIKPDGVASGQYFLEDQITHKLPKHERSKTLFFGTPEGNLQRNDPKQKQLDLRSIDDDKPTELKQA